MKYAEIAAMNKKELQTALHDARVELTEKQRGLKANELQNPRAITELRKRIARIMTALNNKKEEA